MPDVGLSVNSKIYRGWKSVRVERSIENVCGSFEIGTSERLLSNDWVSGFDEGLPVDVGNECTLAVDGTPLVTGYVDDIAREIDASAHAISISGRDKTGDLVDCSAVYGFGTFHNVDLPQIAQILLKPFKIGLFVNTDRGAWFRKIRIESGESVFELLDRLARHRGVLLTTDGRGNLVITRAGVGLSAEDANLKLTRIETSLVLGENILSMRIERSQRDRYSEYTVKGQIPLNENITPVYNDTLKGVAKNETIARYRPLVLVAEQPDYKSSFKLRAEWERNVREGRSTRITVTVQGWQHADGFWTPNRIVHLIAKPLGIEGGDLLIVSVTYTLDENGTRTEMSLTWPWAFDPLPTPEKEFRIP